MSLLTPPATSHRDKENRPPVGSSGCRVAWSGQNQYFLMPSSPEQVSTTAVPHNNPVKSILKKSSQPVLPFENENVRETTPVPEEPMKNAQYLQSAVKKIIAVASSMRDIIEGYSVLAARIRDYVDDDAFRASQCPLLQPVRDNRDAITEVVVRDLSRALEQPPAMEPAAEHDLKRSFGLPSPKASPKKKRSMTEEQVKYARDLGTTCHAVIRFVSVLWTKPAVYSLFTDRQLCDMLTALLAIPLAPELPTPNARKTCALAIWLIQTQRLPEEILYPAKDRIAYAIRRGIEGELGKEGKKGSVNDGYKAIHDLSIHLPSVFIPAFTDLLPSIFSGLLGPTVVVRAQACNALGGFVRGCATLPRLPIHTRICGIVESFVTTPSTALRKSPSPSKLPPESTIVRTLRTTLNVVEPAHAAQGPVWGLCVLASIIVLLGPALSEDAHVFRIISALLNLALRHKKSSIRALLCVVWSCMTHAFFQPPFVEDPDEAAEDLDIDDPQNKVGIMRPNTANRDAMWKLTKNMVDLGAGVTTIATALAADEEDDVKYTRVLTVLNQMVHKGGLPCGHAIQVIQRLVSFGRAPDDYDSIRLLAPGLFSSLGGLLATDWKSVVNAVKPLFDDLPKLEAVRPLTKDELSDERLFEGLMEVWKVGLMAVEIPGDQNDVPEDIASAWEGLLKAKISILQDDGDHDGILEFAEYAVRVLIDTVRDTEIDFTARTATTKSLALSIELPKVLVKSNRSRAALRIFVVRNLWTAFRSMLPRQDISASAEQLMASLRQDLGQIIGEDKKDIDKGAWAEWAVLCAQTLSVCDSDDLKRFWAHVSDVCVTSWPASARNIVWDNFTNEWFSNKDNTRESAMILLGVPFTASTRWDMDESELHQWHQCCLRGASDMAYDAGEDYTMVLNEVAEVISGAHWDVMASSTSPARIADILLQSFGSSDATEIPYKMFEFVNDTLLITYPPEPRNKVICTWLIRTLVRTVEECQSELLVDMLDAVADGLALWIADEHGVFSQDEYALDVLPLYQTVLVTVDALSPSTDLVIRLASVIQAPFLVSNEHSPSTTQAFVEFWRSKHSQLSMPDSWPKQMHDCLAAGGFEHRERSNEVNAENADEVQELDDGYDADTSFHLEAEAGPEDVDDDEPLSYPDSDEEVLHSLLSESPRTSPQALAEVESTASKSSLPFSILTPPSNRTTISTPLAPVKDRDSGPEVSSPPLTAFRARQPTEETQLPNSPRTPTKPQTETPTRSVSAQSFYASSPSQRKSSKENVSPVLNSVRESGEKSLGKRQRVEDHSQEPVQPPAKSMKTKRGRLSVSPIKYPLSVSKRQARQRSSIRSPSSSPSSSPSKRSTINPGCQPVISTDDEDDPFSFHLDDASVSSSKATSSLVFVTPNKKRARVIIDAVEIPAFLLDRDNWIDLSPSSGKKRKRASVQFSHSQTSLVASQRNKRQRPAEEVASSEDSTIQNRIPDSDEVPSSDANVGQVTPHHVISPALRRKGIFTVDDDLPSDDSDMGSSPSRAHAARKQQKSGSYGKEKLPLLSVP